MENSWVSRLVTAAARNRPSQKPQLWEDPLLAARRRLAFEVGKRRDGWMDQLHTVPLSGVGLPVGAPLVMQLRPRDGTNKALFLYGVCEIAETRLVQSLLRVGMTFADIGANIGYYAMLAGRLVGPDGRVFAFEPNPEIHGRLVENARLNGLANVTTSTEAVTDHEGTVTFYASATPENSGISSTIPGAGLGEARIVPATTLDAFAARIGRKLDLVKIDVEGAELQVLEGGRGLLSGPDAPNLIFECFDLAPLAPTLAKLGYTYWRIEYSLGDGLELADPASPNTGIFAAYEPPNYFATKDASSKDAILARANANRSPRLRLLGRV
jgi:FkbM family methyltransferase